MAFYQNRILTTHVGSLVRPPKLVAFLEEVESGRPYDTPARLAGEDYQAGPGHTPGLQVLSFRLAKTGTILAAGDHHHYPEERTARRVPGLDVNKERSLASRAMIEEFLKTSGAQLWIEHDYAANAKLKKARAYHE
jgi:glyoxylase-like metal-dependent hydrolase (beta-lactamase superfamily II)